MRVLWKLSVIVAVGVGVQWLIESPSGLLDEGQFALRAQLSKLRGLPNDDPALVAACNALQHRQFLRMRHQQRQARLRVAAAAAGRPASIQLEPVRDDGLFEEGYGARRVERRPTVGSEREMPQSSALAMGMGDADW